jgi:DNA repair exonuclease SbcCD ATPase subunit
MKTVQFIIVEEQKLIKMDKPSEIVSLDNLSDMQTLMKDMKNLINLLDDCEECTEEVESLTVKEKDAYNLIKQFEKDNKICPLCGNKFKGET